MNTRYANKSVGPLYVNPGNAAVKRFRAFKAKVEAKFGVSITTAQALELLMKKAKEWR